MPIKDPVRRREFSKERQRRYRARHRERVLTRNRETLRMARLADPERFKRYGREWKLKNPERAKEIRQASYKKNRLERIKDATQWAQRNPERKKAIETAWRAANKERVAELALVTNKRYRERNPHVLRAIEALRKRAKQSAPSWAEKDKIRLVYKKAREFGFEVDHVVPLKHQLVCGLHVWANLQLLDRPLNRAKNNRVWPDMP